jgi:hypothetical protein
LTTDLADAYIASAATWNAKVPETRTLTINGTTQDLSANRTFTIATGLTVGTTPITSGTVGRVLFEGTGNVLQQSGSLFWDNTNSRLGIGTSSPTVPLQIETSGLVTGLFINTGNDGGFTSQNNGTLALNRTSQVRLVNGSTIFGANDRTYQLVNIGRSSTTADFYFQYWNGSTYNERLRIFSTGNVSIGTTTDAGYKLDVNGTSRFVGDSIIQGSNALSGANALLVRNTSSVHGLSVTNNAEVKIGRNQLFTISDTSTGGYVFSIAASNSGISFTNTALGSRPVSFSMNTGEILRIHQSYTAIVTNSFLVGTTTDVASSILTLASTTKGFLPPRMTNAQRLAIASPAVGLIVYCTDAVEGLYVNKSTGWTFVI